MFPNTLRPSPSAQVRFSRHCGHSNVRTCHPSEPRAGTQQKKRTHVWARIAAWHSRYRPRRPAGRKRRCAPGSAPGRCCSARWPDTRCCVRESERRERGECKGQYEPGSSALAKNEAHAPREAKRGVGLGNAVVTCASRAHRATITQAAGSMQHQRGATRHARTGRPSRQVQRTRGSSDSASGGQGRQAVPPDEGWCVDGAHSRQPERPAVGA